DPVGHLPAVGIGLSRDGKPVNLTTKGDSDMGDNPMTAPADAQREDVDRRFVMPIRLDKGKRVRTVLNLTRYFDLSVPGDYQLVATWGGTRSGGVDWIPIKTKPL